MFRPYFVINLTKDTPLNQLDGFIIEDKKEKFTKTETKKRKRAELSISRGIKIEVNCHAE
jgi:hypothetical protein